MAAADGGWYTAARVMRDEAGSAWASHACGARIKHIKPRAVETNAALFIGRQTSVVCGFNGNKRACLLYVRNNRRRDGDACSINASYARGALRTFRSIK